MCDNPKCPGWLHMHDSMGRGPGIERCDDCARFPDDDAARAAHDATCPTLARGRRCRFVAEQRPKIEWVIVDSADKVIDGPLEPEGYVRQSAAEAVARALGPEYRAVRVEDSCITTAQCLALGL